MGVPENVNWNDDEYWKNRRLSPAQLQVFDVRLQDWNQSEQANPMIEIDETLPSSLYPALSNRDRLANELDVEKLTQNRSEQNAWRRVISDYGWMNCLRSKGIQQNVDDPKELRKLRWVHVSSQFTEYLQGCLLALSNWKGQREGACADTLRQLEHSIYQNERFSKHGRYFNPFMDKLGNADAGEECPMLISVPFLDWSADDPVSIT